MRNVGLLFFSGNKHKMDTTKETVPNRCAVSAAQIKPWCVFVFMLVDGLIACVDSKCTHACLLWLCFLVVVPPLCPHSCFSFSLILLGFLNIEQKYPLGLPSNRRRGICCNCRCVSSLLQEPGKSIWQPPLPVFYPAAYLPSRVWCSLKWTFFPLPGTFSNAPLPR